MFTKVCVLDTRPGRSHPEVGLHYFLRLSPLEMKVNPQDRTTAVISKHPKITFIATCHFTYMKVSGDSRVAVIVSQMRGV